MKNGSSPTAQMIDGITVDLNRVTRVQFYEFNRLVSEAGVNRSKVGELTADFAARVITAWPFETEITPAGYLSLPWLDVERVDDALLAAIESVVKKKSESSSTPPENSTGA